MSNHTIQPTMLKENETVFVRGNVVFSRITRHITGEELQKDQQRRQRLGLNPILKPYITITVNNARVIPATPGKMTAEEQYVQERFYKRGQDPSDIYSIQSKSPYLPWIGQANSANPQQIDQIKPVGEPANGLDVTLVLRTFQAGVYANKGWNLDGLIANEPIRYYSSADTASRMAAAGLTFNPLPAGSIPATDLEIPAAPIENAPSVPADEPTQVTPPVGNPYANAAPAGFGMTPPDTGAWICPKCGSSSTGNFCNSCGSPKPAGNPYAGTAPQAGGIMYDPSQFDNNY